MGVFFKLFVSCFQVDDKLHDVVVGAPSFPMSTFIVIQTTDVRWPPLRIRETGRDSHASYVIIKS